MCFLVSSSLTVCTSLKVERFFEQLFTDIKKHGKAFKKKGKGW
jgi:hypothetical protein